MDEIVTLQPWSPWPLIFPALVLIAAVAMSIVGARRRVKPIREAGYVAFIVAALTAGAMAWTMSGIWDAQQRTVALVALGYTTPTFGGSMDLSGGELQPIGFQAVRDGERVRGALTPLGGEQWRIIESDESDESDE